MSTRYNFAHNEATSRAYRAAAGTVRTCFRRFPKKALFAEVHVNGHKAARRSLKRARERTIHYLKTTRPGTEIVVEVFESKDAKTRLDVARFYKTEVAPPVKDGPGSPGIDAFESYVETFYPTARWAGDCVCKSTVSGGHSDHADCAAVDYFDTEANILKMIHDFCTNVSTFHPKYALWKYTIYKPDGRGGVYSGPSGAAYHAHGHFSTTDGQYNSACSGDREWG